MNLYTCKHYFPFAPIIIVLLVPLSLGIYYLFNFVNKNPFVEKPNKLLTSGIILVLVSIILLSIYLSAYINDYKSIFAKKIRQNYKPLREP